MRKKKHMAMKLLSMSLCTSDGASRAITKVVMVDKGKRVDGVDGLLSQKLRCQLDDGLPCRQQLIHAICCMGGMASCALPK